MSLHPLRSSLILMLALLLGPLAAPAKPADSAGPEPTAEQRRATSLITRFVESYHYKKTPLNDELSATIFEQYLKALDPNRSYFTAGDIEALQADRLKMDDFLRGAKLEEAFRIFSLFRGRLAERVEHAKALLEKDFDFGVDERFQFDRSEAEWAPDQAALDEIWRKRVKNDVLTMRLSGEKEADIKDVLAKRYERLLRRVDQLDTHDVYQMFINAYTVSIEPHTAYFSPRTAENFKIRMSLSLEGIGAALQTENDYTVVKQIVPGGPAEISGLLHAGDRITGVGQGSEPVVDVVAWRLEDVVDLIRGPKDTVVRLEILPKDTTISGPRKIITLVRNRIELEQQAAKKHVIESPAGRVGVIDVPTFYMDAESQAAGDPEYRSTTRDVRRLLGELEKDKVLGVIIDLRGNGGGSLTEATELTGLFIDSGPVVQIKDYQGRIHVQRDPNPDLAYSGPLAVMVDHQSASASEIFAGAIQDYGRGIIIGEPTYGKGTVQQLIDLDRYARGSDAHLGQLKTTIAQFFRISGESTQLRGVVPDIVLPTAKDAEERGERSLDNPLPWASVTPAAFKVRGKPRSVLEEVRRRHEARIGDNEMVRVLLEDAKAQRAVREKVHASLLESARRAEHDSSESAQLERLNRFRAARGLTPLAKGEEAPEETDEEKLDSDVWLKEAAVILGDMVNLSTGAKQMEAAAAEPAVVAR